MSHLGLKCFANVEIGTCAVSAYSGIEPDMKPLLKLKAVTDACVGKDL